MSEERAVGAGERRVLLVCGSRSWVDRGLLIAALDQVQADHGPFTVLVHGAARGADRMAGEWAERRGIEVIACPAQWDEHGRSAGPIRNRHMLAAHRPDRVVAFKHAAKARGTDHMVAIARDAGCPVDVHIRTDLPRRTPDSAVQPKAGS